MRKVLLQFLHILFLSALCAPSWAQLPLIQEAEDCRVTCKAGMDMQGNVWARGYKVTPAFWGRETGDSITWEITLKYPHDDLSLGVRYSYAHGHYSSMFPANPKRTLNLTVDNKPPVEIKVPDTGWWDLFETASVRLPKLTAGKHILKIAPPEPNMTTNIDTLIIFSGKLESLPAKLRRTTVAESKHFVLRISYGAKLIIKPEDIFKEFERIYDCYSKYMGWEWPVPIPINLIEDDKWPDPNSTAFQNAGGLYFRANQMAHEQGNWVHEMVHMFYAAHFPGWFDEPSVVTLTTFVFYPKLVNKGKPDDDPIYRRSMETGKDVLANPDTTFDSVEPILYALVVKYGPDVYSRFFHSCVEAGKKGEINFTPGRWLTKDEMIRLMSKAAGEDVTPMFKRWKGFASAQ